MSDQLAEINTDFNSYITEFQKVQQKLEESELDRDNLKVLLDQANLLQTQINDEMIEKQQKNTKLAEQARDVEMQNVNYQANLTDDENLISNAKEQVAQVNGELGATQSECLHLRHINQNLTDGLFRDA